MQIGSLVELVDDKWDKCLRASIRPIKGKVYEVMGFAEYPKGAGIYLMEHAEVIQVFKGKKLIKLDFPCYLASRFRELQPPMTISVESVLEMEVIES